MNGYAQNNVGIGTNTPNAAAKLDITSTTQGLLPPRMNTVQRNAITACMIGPQMAAIQSLTIYNTNSLCLESFIGTTWQPIGCGCSSAPVKPGAIAGTFPICQGSTNVAFSINAVFGATDYTWSIPASTGTIVTGNGSTAIPVDFLPNATTGILTVVANNSCGISPASTQSITDNLTPTLGNPTAANICEGNTATITLPGLLAGTNSINFSISGSAQTAVNVTGTSGSFTTPILSAGQTVQITGITQTSSSPQCAATFAKNVPFTVNAIPTLSTATQPVGFCVGAPATINLSGLLPNSTFTIAYKIAAAVQTAKTGVIADGSGNGSFITPNLALADNGKILQITGITRTDNSPNCSSGALAVNVTLAVNTPTVPTISGYTIVGANETGVTYSIVSTVVGHTYTWTVSGGKGAISGSNVGETISVTWSGNTVGTAMAATTISAIHNDGNCNSTAGTLSVIAGGKITFKNVPTDGGDQFWCGSNYGVTSSNVQLLGAGGGSPNNSSFNFSSGGSGGYISGTLLISAGSTLTIIAGRGGKPDGSASYGGGGTGGSTTLSRSGGGRSAIIYGGTEVAIAGGGGGYGYAGTSYGGAGGGATGGIGGGGGPYVAATGGTQIAGGIGGNYNSLNNGADGISGTGGGGNTTNLYVGGGPCGGGANVGGGGGAGGSSYTGGLTGAIVNTAGLTGTGGTVNPGYTG